jgi:two-component system, NtrC family, sensor kinase
MDEQKSILAPSILAQLKEACKLTRARWAAWLQLADGQWAFTLSVNLSKGKQSNLLKFLGDPGTATWLAGTLASGRLRSRQTGTYSNVLGCQRLFVLPVAQYRISPTNPSVLLVGIDNLEKPLENIFRILVLNPPISQNPSSWQRNRASGDQNAPQKNELGHFRKPAQEKEPSVPLFAENKLSGELEVYAGVAASPERVLQNVLELLAGYVDCDAAYIAIRSGDRFDIEASSGWFSRTSWEAGNDRQLPAKTGSDYHFLTGDNRVLAQMVASRQGLIFDDGQLRQKNMDWFLPETGGTVAQSGMCLPITLGQRVIGLVSFVSAVKGAYNQAALQQISRAVSRLAYVIENALMFSETARYLQQLALLNEMASSASLSVDTHQVARRVMERLRRTFHIEWAGVYLLSQDRTLLDEYGGPATSENLVDLSGQDLADPGRRSVRVELQPPELSLLTLVVETGRPYRGRNCAVSLAVEPAPDLVGGSDTQKVLIVPLKYQGAVIGALALQSVEKDGFSLQDEQLLVGIASHLAGFFENMRLNEETRQRAQKLQDTVRQLQTVRETTIDIGESAAGSPSGNLDLHGLLQRVVQRARQLVDARGAELGLLDEKKLGFGLWVSDLPWGNEEHILADLAERVASTGEAVVVNDFKNWHEAPVLTEMLPLSATVCMPLKYQSSVIGVLIVSDDRPEKIFRPEDIQLLELFSPLVTVWIRNTRLYQELQERIEAQEEAENRLIRSARLAAVGEMAAGVAHEMNNPLTTVVGFVELVLEDLPKESPYYPDLELVLQESQRARGVVRRLLDFSRPPENQHVRTDLNELVSDVLTLVHHLVRTGGVEMHIELWNELPWINVDPGQIKQVLLNLIHNAIQAMPKGGTLTVKTAPVERNGQDWLVISIADTGIGIPPENLGLIFEPFFTTRHAARGSSRALSSTPQKTGEFQGNLFTEETGTGLGLSVSYGIVSEHHGSIEVESQPGQGSCFTIYLPVEKSV